MRFDSEQRYASSSTFSFTTGQEFVVRGHNTSLRISSHSWEPWSQIKVLHHTHCLYSGTLCLPCWAPVLHLTAPPYVRL